MGAKKYTGDLVTFNTDGYGVIEKLGIVKQATQIQNFTKDWCQRIGIDPSTRIELSYIENDRYCMLVDPDAAQYKAFHVWFTSKCLRKERDNCREMDVLHEMLHILLWQNYIRNVYGITDEQYHDFIGDHEETLVTTLELSFYRSKYGQDCKMPKPFFEYKDPFKELEKDKKKKKQFIK